MSESLKSNLQFYRAEWTGGDIAFVPDPNGHWVRRADVRSAVPPDAPTSKLLAISMQLRNHAQGVYNFNAFRAGAIDDLADEIDQVAQSAVPPPTRCHDETIKGLCDRLDEINKVCASNATDKLRQIELLSDGFMPIPPCSQCGEGHAEPEQDCPSTAVPPNDDLDKLRRRVAQQDDEFASCFRQNLYLASALWALTREDTPLNKALDEATGESKAQYQALLSVIGERRRQVECEGWTAEHDDEHDEGQLAGAAASYAMHAADVLCCASQGDGGWSENPPEFWPWDDEWWKPSGSGTNQAGVRRDLVKAGALILAEIERIDRQASTKKEARQ